MMIINFDKGRLISSSFAYAAEISKEETLPAATENSINQNASSWFASLRDVKDVLSNHALGIVNRALIVAPANVQNALFLASNVLWLLEQI